MVAIHHQHRVLASVAVQKIGLDPAASAAGQTLDLDLASEAVQMIDPVAGQKLDLDPASEAVQMIGLVVVVVAATATGPQPDAEASAAVAQWDH